MTHNFFCFHAQDRKELNSTNWAFEAQWFASSPIEHTPLKCSVFDCSLSLSLSQMLTQHKLRNSLFDFLRSLDSC